MSLPILQSSNFEMFIFKMVLYSVGRQRQRRRRSGAARTAVVPPAVPPAPRSRPLLNIP